MSLLSLIHFTGLDFLPAAFDYTSAARFGCRLTVVAQQALLSIISALRSICAESLWRVWREIIRQMLVVAAYSHITPIANFWLKHKKALRGKKVPVICKFYVP